MERQPIDNRDDRFAERVAPGRTLLVGCGKLGTRLGERLIEAGGQVFALRRNTAALPSAFSKLPVDLTEPVADELPTVDAMVITLPPGAQGVPDQPNGYLASLRHLAAALPVMPRRVVFVSSTRVFEGRTDGRTLTEEDAPAPLTWRGDTLHEGELLASELFDAHAVRPAGIYGPGREMLIRKVIEGTPVQYAQRTNRIHETDLVRTLEAMLVTQDPPAVLHAVDQAPATLGEVVTYIAHQLRLEPPPAIQPELPGGTVLSGALLLSFLGSLQYPTFAAGYDHIIATRDPSVTGQP
jgi:nucleoside-diphosphate-sugar epimerase